MTIWQKIESFYIKYDRHIASIFLVPGFVINMLTLRRVDLFWENFWIVAHILAVGVLIFQMQYIESRQGEKSSMHFWYLSLLQFLFGGIFSTYLVFYFRSGDFFASLPFYLLLIAVFAANELFKKNASRLVFQIAMMFMSVYVFAIFILPVLMHRIGAAVFLLAGVLSMVFIYIFTELLFRLVVRGSKKLRIMLSLVIIGLFALVNILYFTNLIPPMPFSMREGQVYHQVLRTLDGNYRIIDESRSWLDRMRFYRPIHITHNPVYAFSAVFSPPGFMTEIIHKWQWYDSKNDNWITRATVSLPVIGGRDGGFRTYSKINNLTPGLWRVNIETPEGQTIDRIRVRAIEQYPIPDLKEIKK